VPPHLTPTFVLLQKVIGKPEPVGSFIEFHQKVILGAASPHLINKVAMKEA
jgi:hypothetical protein